MQLRLKPKTYGPLVVDSPAPDVLNLTSEAGHRAAGAPTPQPQGLSPSDLLLASLASCITISMRMAAQQMGLDLGALSVSASATKATDLPNRFARLSVDAVCSVPVPPAQHDELLRRTKAICTVSNTLGAEVVLRLGTGLSATATSR